MTKKELKTEIERLRALVEKLEQRIALLEAAKPTIAPWIVPTEPWTFPDNATWRRPLSWRSYSSIGDLNSALYCRAVSV